MKKFRSTFILLGILALLLLVFVFFGSDSAEKRRIQTEVEAPVFSERQIRQIDEIIFKGKDTSVSLLKEGDDWMVEGILVDQDEQTKLDDALLSFVTGKMVSKSSNNWENYGLDESAASQLTLKSGEEAFMTVFFGTPGPGYQSTYVRRESDESVYLVNTALDDFLAYDQNRWKSKALFTIEPTDVQSFSTRVGDEKWQFALRDGSWNWMEGDQWVAVDAPDELETYLKNLLSLKADGIESDSTKFVAADNAVALTLTSGEEYVVLVDRDDDGQFFASVSDIPHLFRLSNDLTARLKPDFLLNPAPEPEISETDEPLVN